MERLNSASKSGWPSTDMVAIFEAKYLKEVKNLEEDCEKAIQQIDHRMYAKEFEDSYDEVICYGISFYKKRCVVKRRK